MFEACRKINPEKWDFLAEYHGTHITQHNKAMQTLCEKRFKYGELLDMYAIEKDNKSIYDLLVSTVG
jgi:hypothetical protein